ncbi:MAG: Asp-tRNA(Asn)/Glu-tRNA(Gln) amidotransferase GatCAB subunit B, partial [Thermomicrobiales bacterium]
GNMEEGALRCDANISTRSVDGSIVGSKVEIKNMNSFRTVERALRFEEERQRRVLADGGSIEQETRGWVETRGVTVSQRTKEQAHDYRYFPEPDLPPLALTGDVVESIATRLPELPGARRARVQAEYGIGESDAALLTSERSTADYFETVARGSSEAGRPRVAANWILNDLFGLQRERGLAADTMPVSASQLSNLIAMLESDLISARAAKELLVQLGPDEEPEEKARQLDLLPLDDDGALRTAALATLDALPAAADDYRSGKTAAIGRLIGETIKRTGGRGRPDAVRKVLEQLLKEHR